jgi:hypothetical protein
MTLGPVIPMYVAVAASNPTPRSNSHEQGTGQEKGSKEKTGKEHKGKAGREKSQKGEQGIPDVRTKPYRKRRPAKRSDAGEDPGYR